VNEPAGCLLALIPSMCQHCSLMIRFSLMLAALLSVASCGQEGNVEKVPEDLHVVLSGATMGTTWRVTVSGGELVAKDLQSRLEQRLESFEDVFSHWRRDSVVSRFNRHRSLDPVSIPAEFAELIRIAQRISAETGGAFDITSAPLVRLWGYGPEGKGLPDTNPSQEELAKALHRVGMDKLVIGTNPDKPTLIKSDPAVELDFSAVAKGYAVDLLYEDLIEMELETFLIEIGGEIRGKGRAWRIGLESPRPAQFGKLRGSVALFDAALATSGNYRQPGHLIDPRTGERVEGAFFSVSVLANTAAEADAYATALSVDPELAAGDFAERVGVEFSIAVLKPNGGLEVQQSQWFTAFVR